MLAASSHFVAELVEAGGPVVALMAQALGDGFGTFSDAIDKYESVLDYLRRSSNSQQDMRIASTLIAMSLSYAHRRNDGDLDRAIRCCRETDRILAGHLGDKHPAVLVNRFNLCSHLRATDRNAAALPLLESLISSCRELYGNNSSETITAILMTARTHRDISKLKTLPEATKQDALSPSDGTHERSLSNRR